MSTIVAPRLVLVHGSLSSRHSWDAYPDLLPGVDVVMPDLPGHGDNRDRPFTTASALAAIAEAVGPSAAPWCWPATAWAATSRRCGPIATRVGCRVWS